ncbi:unnamed protein product [Adineta ricciae]|uniref:Uncharacterized protein n=1 Tax=Adineta ricciae TaxID=249248 RepID=A0A815TE76_ADIRI|nr:unnamed protein product [Adineta ricciae]
MANYRSSTHPIAADFSAVLQRNFDQLNSLPSFNVDFIDEDEDWYLHCFLKEQQRNGHSFEITLSALSSIVGTLSEYSSFVNPINNTMGYLNQNHHIIGESASNKSSICNEIGLALHNVTELFPGKYSSSNQYSDENANIVTNGNQNQPKSKTKSNEMDYNLVLSNVTEVGLVMNLSKINTLLLHGDGDVALQKLGYYEQGKNETAAGISLFCEASDGIRSGFIRGTGVSSIKIGRPVALMSTFIASTGTKMAPMLQRLHETPFQDGVFGRMFYTWCESVTDLPKARSSSYTNIASFSHFAYAVACLFEHVLQFRYSAHPNDFSDANEERLDYEERLVLEREKQGVDTPVTYSNILNHKDTRSDRADGNENMDENNSSFKLLKTLLDDWWKSSNSSERHFKSIRRKVILMMSKCIWSMKIIRIIFQLMSKILKTIDQKQGDRAASSSASMDLAFQHAIQASIKTYLFDNCQQIESNKWIMWSDKTDVIIGYNWYLRKMLVTETFLSLKSLPDIIENRLGRRTVEKDQHEIKLEKAMVKVMSFSVVFFTRRYMTSNKNGAGSGQFCHIHDLKPDQILSPLIDSGLLIGGSFIKCARPGNDGVKYASFCKQLPSVIQTNPRIRKAFEDLGLNMTDYENTFQHQRLPLNAEFTDEAIEFIRATDDFAQYYHNYYKEGARFQSFRTMVDERIRLGQIVDIQDKMLSSSQISTNPSQNDPAHDNPSQLNISSSRIPIVKLNSTKPTAKTNNVGANCKITSSTIKILSDRQSRTTTDEVVENHLRTNNVDIVDRIIQDQLIASSSNSNENAAVFPQSSEPNGHSSSFYRDAVDDSSRKGSDLTSIASVNDRQHDESYSSPFLSKTTSFSIDDLPDQRSALSMTTAVSEHILDDQLIDPVINSNEENGYTSIDSSRSDDERPSSHESAISIDNSFGNVPNNIDSHQTHVDNLLLSPQSFGSVWKSILIKRQFLLGTSTDLFRMIPCKLFDEKSRFKVIDFLLHKKLLVQADWFCDSKGNSIQGYLKGSPADPDVSMALADVGIDIEEYKRCLKSVHDGKRILDGKIMNQSYLFSIRLQRHIQHDQWFSQNISIDERFLFVEKRLLQTISNFQTDEFRKQKKEKVAKKLTNKRKRTDELQKETLLICGTDLGAKRKRKPKMRDD